MDTRFESKSIKSTLQIRVIGRIPPSPTTWEFSQQSSFFNQLNQPIQMIGNFNSLGGRERVRRQWHHPGKDSRTVQFIKLNLQNIFIDFILTSKQRKTFFQQSSFFRLSKYSENRIQWRKNGSEETADSINRVAQLNSN